MTDAPRDLARWSLHCFCLRARSNPKKIIGLDNNGEVLFHLIEGGTADELRTRGVEITQSQLALLEAYRLIEPNGAGHITKIPVLGPDQIGVVREATAQMARAHLADVVTHAREIATLLSERGLRSSTYAVVFGHALDGVIWDLLRARGDLPEIDLTIEEPFWRGSFWAVYPGRAGSAGTNEHVEGDKTLVMVWDDATAIGLGEVAADPEMPHVLRSLPRGAKSVVLHGLPIPVLHPSDPLHRAAVVLAQTVAAVIPERRVGKELIGGTGIEVTPEDASVILTHEVIWEVSNALTETGVVGKTDRSGLGSRLFVRVGG
jgi:hypothetical protein